MKVIFGDHVSDKFWSIEITDADELYIDDIWKLDDTLFLNMKNNIFENIFSWSDLDLIHYQILIYATFDLVKNSDDKLDEITTRFREPFYSLRLIATSLIKYFYLNNLQGFDTLYISRSDDNKIHINTEKKFVFSFNETKPKNKLQLVIDNTKKV